MSSQKIITKGEDQRKLYKVFDLWLKLCELSDEFNKAHSLLFFFYFNNVNVAFIFFAYITMNNSTYEDTVNRLMQATALFTCASIIYMICETAFSVYERVGGILAQTYAILKDNIRYHFFFFTFR